MPNVRRSSRDERAEIRHHFHHWTIVGRTKIEFENFLRTMPHRDWGLPPSLL